MSNKIDSFDTLDQVFEVLDNDELTSVQGGKSVYKHINNFGYWFNRVSIDLGY